MKKFVQIFSLWMFFLLGACTKEPGYHVEHYKEIKIEDIPADIKVPSKVWDLLEFKPVTAESHEEKKAEGHGEAKAEGEHGGGEEKKEGGEKKEGAGGKDIVFSELSVFLVEKNDDIVKGEAVKISLPKGGGEIDLAQYITTNKGSFYVGFDFPQFTESTAQKVVFLSKTRKRRIDDKVLGAGCNQFLDITTTYTKEMAKAGLKVNTVRERYITVLGGTFFFSAQKAGTTYISQVTFKDSRYQNLFCEVP
ncbi:hypothetical protein [Bdellovibrio sp. NC01]|uniref:hypothetical protein n=1 Tax=Bdellovibrio sp. NC01 TaxID=2220073 RepID=UPI00115870DA|nr:hypothetical protein [Bdellovibrio sp. NC01]QDK38909.1 hypothetical protein DOE51_15610 [Bdellovibrio sp. NC01]